jgi:CMP-2-keto-3-deoxyoctulosonic acid synthetase
VALLDEPVALSVLGVIPARLASTRLPRKVLRPLAGRPLVAWVYDAARKAPDLGDVVVATDAAEVMDACRGLGIPAVLTSPDHPSGTDRVWEVAQGAPPTSTSTSRATSRSSPPGTSQSWSSRFAVTAARR